MRRGTSGVQAASDVNSPVSGEVTEVNSSLTDESSKVPAPLYGMHSATLHKGMYIDWSELMLFAFRPSQVNQEPYSGGWMMKVKLSDKGELKNLMDPAQYEDHCAKSEH